MSDFDKSEGREPVVLNPPLEVNTVLYTKDGRRMGNAIIVRVETSMRKDYGLKTIYHIKTDYGNDAKMTEGEIQNEFHISEYDLVNMGSPHKHAVYKVKTTGGPVLDSSETKYFPMTEI